MESSGSGGDGPDKSGHNQANAGDDSETRSNDESGSVVHREKLAKLQKYLPFLNATIAKLESSKDKVRASQLSKMKNLQQILTSSNKRMKIDTLDRCEQVLKKLEEKIKFPISQDSSESNRCIKTEPEEVIESPASPPQPDLNPPRCAPKIIPVERCATVERDFSKAEEETTLESSRERLKGLMLKSDCEPTSSISSKSATQIPGLDLLFSSTETHLSHRPIKDDGLKSFGNETRDHNEFIPPPQEEWARLEPSYGNKRVSGDWPESREDIDERRIDRNLDFRRLRNDIDDRQLLDGTCGMQSPSGGGRAPLLKTPVSHSTPSLLPRFMPTHNMGYPLGTCSSSQEFQRPNDSDRSIATATHQSVLKPIGSSNIQSNAALVHVDQRDYSSSHPRFPVSQRDNFEISCKIPLLPTPKPFSSSLPHAEFDQRSLLSCTQLSSKGHSNFQLEVNKPSARERIMQQMDEVKKLGVSSGGALRKLKSDIGKKRPVETDVGNPDESCQRVDMMPRKVDPRLEKEQRRNSTDEEAQKLKIASRIPSLISPDSPGFGSSALPSNTVGFPVSSLFSSNFSNSTQWNQSHVSSTRSIHQNQSNVSTVQWQSTSLAKQTTAHDLGLRYQPRSRHGKFIQKDRSMSSKLCEEKNRDTETPFGHGRRQSDPRLTSMKSTDDKRVDLKNFDPRKKDNCKDQDDKDHSSPLNSLYNNDKRIKTGQGYGLQHYKIPKRTKEPNPLKDMDVIAKQSPTDPRLCLNRDPRLSKTLPRLASPEPSSELPENAKCLRSSCELTDEFSNPVIPDRQESLDVGIVPTSAHGTVSGKLSLSKEGKEILDPCNSPLQSKNDPISGFDKIHSPSPSNQGSLSPCPEKSRHESVFNDPAILRGKNSQCLLEDSTLGRSRSREKSPLLSQMKTRSTSREQTRERSHSRSRSQVSERSSSRTRGRSLRRSRSRVRVNSRISSRSRSRDYSRGRSSSRKREKSRGHSASRTRSKSRERSSSRARDKSVSRSTTRPKTRSSSRTRGRSRDRSRGGDTSKSRGRSHARSSSRSRDKSRARSTSRSQGRSRRRSTSRPRDRSLSRVRGRSRYRSSSRDQGRSSSRDQERSSSRSRGRTESRNRSLSRSSQLRYSSRPRSKPGEDFYKLKRKPSRSKSPPTERKDRRSYNSRALSQSSDSDKNSESPSPDRELSRKWKSKHRSRKRSISSSSNRSVGSPSSSNRSRDRSRKRGRSRRHHEARKRSLSRGSLKTIKKSVVSSRSSSCSGRSSPLFPKERSESKSPLRERVFDTLLKKGDLSEAELPGSSCDMKVDCKEQPQSSLKDVVVSSSLTLSTEESKFSSCGDVVVDVPTSTSENIPETVCKPDVGSSSEASIRVGSASSTGGSGEAESIIFGLIKQTLANKDIFIELAELAASRLPEDKRAQVLEIFKEVSKVPKDNEDVNKIDSTPSTSAIGASTANPNPNPSVNLHDRTVSCSVKEIKRKQKSKVKTLRTPRVIKNPRILDNNLGSEEKQKKKRGKNELEKLHEDIREMFISKEVVTATGQRSCRIRKETNVLSQPKCFPSSSDEKLKSKSSFSNVVELSDDSPTKTLMSDTSLSDCQPVSSICKKIKYSSESDEEVPATKWRKTDAENDESKSKTNNKMRFPGSESESDSNVQDKKKFDKLPLVVLEHMRPARRNVARRGRRTCPLPRDQVKVYDDDYTLTYDGDGDDEEEESKVEDKDMSQIDTSNIIHVEGAGSKLTRNQLKRLKDPVPNCKEPNRKGFPGYKELSESESDASQTSGSLLGRSNVSGTSDSSPSPLKKKKRLRKSQNLSSSVSRNSQNKGENGSVANLDTGEEVGLDRGPSPDTLDDNTSLDDSINILLKDIAGKAQDDTHPRKDKDPCVTAKLLLQKENLEGSAKLSSSVRRQYHEDLTYTISTSNDKVSCKICHFSGKTIVAHYVSCHPTEDVFISRLPRSLADHLKAEAVNYDSDLQVLLNKYSSKKRLTMPLKCRICNYVGQTALRLYEHVSSHTGEYRFSCTQCPFRGSQRESMKSHRKTRHSKNKLKEICHSVTPEAVINMKVLFAYLCSKCNFFQLLESSLEKHVQLCHSDAKVIRVCVSEETTSKSVNLKEEDPLIDGRVEPVIIAKNVTECQRNAIENPCLSMEKDDELSKVITIEKSVNASSLSSQVPSGHAVSVDMSIFVGSDQLSDDESQVEEKRRKLLKDAEVKIRGRPQIRGIISEKLAQRLQSEPLPSLNEMTGSDCSTLEINQVHQNVEENSSCEAFDTPGKANSRTTQGRTTLKSCDSTEKRFTRSTSRTSVATSDSEAHTAQSGIPDEIKDPLPVSILHNTLQRMQETIQYPVSSFPAKNPVSSASEVSPHSKFVLKKGTVRVGLVEARLVEKSHDVLFICLSPNCTFKSAQAFLFQEHFDKHSPKPVSAPCSICDDGGNILRDLPSSFNHLVKYHLHEVDLKEVLEVSSHPPPAVPIDTSKHLGSGKPTLIRPRKLPGDVLSLPEKTTANSSQSLLSEATTGGLPSLVISSVISLSKDHTPDGMPLMTQRSDAVTSSIQTESKSYDSVSISSLPSMKCIIQFRKDQNCMKVMMRTNKVCHLFKCMGQHCSFSTNSKENFADHYQRHLLKESYQNMSAFHDRFQWQKCVYCGEDESTGKDLASHILMYHGILRYQCSGCFYRAATKEGVAFHQEKSHTSKVIVFDCHSLLQDVGTVMPNQLLPHQLSQIDQIQVYKCCQDCGQGQCGMIFVSSEDFLSHQESLHSSDKIFYCCECGLGLDCSSKLICHYSTSHSYRQYHCLYCPKASETKDEISCHMCLDHPDRYMYVAARVHQSNQGSTVQETLQLPSGALIGLANLGSIFSNHNTIAAPIETETDSNSDPLFLDNEPSLHSFIFDIGAKSAWIPKCPPVLTSLTPPSGCFDDKNGGSTEFAQKCKSSVLEAPADSDVTNLIGSGTDSCSIVKENNGGSRTDIGAVGLSGSSLFKCGYLGCLFKTNTSFLFKEHILSCGLSRESATLMCPHCPKVCRNPSLLMEHLPKHGIPRYICGLCDDFRATHQNSALRHLKNKHKLDGFELVQSNPFGDDPDTSLFIVRPKEMTSKRMKTKAQNPALHKTSYGPNERHLLPLSSVFTIDVSCSVCQYATKVRSNMLRHLEQHALGCEPSPVPVLNPVPCLERNEKMFDTMTNHAISSTIPVRRDSNAFKVTDEPKFVPENQRYVCCAPACHQISSDDAMLRHHIRVLHPEILVYKCPHCPESDSDGKQPILLEKLGSHLKMHDSRLYSCLSCTYYHYHRHIVERHTSEKHPDQMLIRIVREPQPDGPSDTENVIDTESEIVGAEGAYECTLCSFRGFRVEVIAHVASVHRINTLYKCSYCNFRTNHRSRFASHFSKNHPHEEEDFIELVQKIKIEKAVDEMPQPPPKPVTPPIEPVAFDSTPLWRRNSHRIRHLRGILFEENGLKPREMEHCETKYTEVSRNKRPVTVDNMPSSKREKKETLSCMTCLMKFATHQEKDYREHIRLHFLNDENRFKCAECVETFSKYDDAATHVAANHKRDPTGLDVVDLLSADQINLDITLQLQDLRPCIESSNCEQVSRVSPNFNETPTKNPERVLTNSPRRSNSTVKRKSPRSASGGVPSISKSKIISAPKNLMSTDVFNKSSFKGVQPLNKTSPLEPTIPNQTKIHHALELPSSAEDLDNCLKDLGETLAKQNCSLSISLEDEDVDVEVDESALELDIEEVEDEELSHEENVPKGQGPSSLLEKGADTSQSTRVQSNGISCKYKESHGCNFVSKSKLEALYHEKRHWEVKPLQCGLCSYQAVKECHIRNHSVRKHPGLPVKIIINDLPTTPNILRLSRQPTKPKAGKCPASTAERKILDNLAEITDYEEVLRSMNVLRCGFCRLRETSLCRLFAHWQSTHRNNNALLENTNYGKRLVPFKFREMKVGDREKETMAFRCALCSRTGTVKLLAEHYPSRHPGEKLKISELIHNRVQCSLCPRQFSSKAALTGHFTSSHPGEQVSSNKVVIQSTSDDLDVCMACVYCMEPMKTASDMKDHHLNFHSHLEPKFIELDANESDD